MRISAEKRHLGVAEKRPEPLRAQHRHPIERVQRSIPVAKPGEDQRQLIGEFRCRSQLFRTVPLAGECLRVPEGTPDQRLRRKAWIGF